MYLLRCAGLWCEKKPSRSCKHGAPSLVLRRKIRILPFQDAAAMAYGSIRTDLERRGELIGPTIC